MRIHQREFAEGDRTNSVLGRGLGFFSIGLGLAELATPRAVAKLIGVAEGGSTVPLLRAFGAREVATGLGLLAKPQAATGPWSRVIGDAIDVAFLVWALSGKSVSRMRTVGALAAVAGVMAVDAYAGIRRNRAMLGEPIRRAITINVSPQEVYAVWRNVERLPEIMTWVESVTPIDDRCSHWRVRTPAGPIEFDAEMIEDVPGQRIAWQSMPGAPIASRGQVTFMTAPGQRGCEVIVEMQVAAPLAKVIAGGEAQGDLRRLKQVLETGEVMRSDASIHKGPHPARPSERGGV